MFFFFLIKQRDYSVWIWYNIQCLFWQKNLSVSISFSKTFWNCTSLKNASQLVSLLSLWLQKYMTCVAVIVKEPFMNSMWWLTLYSERMRAFLSQPKAKLLSFSTLRTLECHCIMWDVPTNGRKSNRLLIHAVKCLCLFVRGGQTEEETQCLFSSSALVWLHGEIQM